MTFQGPSLKAASGNTKSLVVFLHGYGSNGDDLISLGRQWASVLPDTDFLAPNGPEICEQYSDGYQWCSMKDWDPMRLATDMGHVSPVLNRYVDAELKARSLDLHQVAFVGFSQGTFMALEAAIHRPTCGGVVGYSGGFFHDPSRLMVGRPPIILIHGKDDTLVKPDASLAAENALKSLGLKVETHIIPGLEHSIDIQGLGIGAGFLKENLMEN